jgi:hypothetical protein
MLGPSSESTPASWRSAAAQFPGTASPNTCASRSPEIGGYTPRVHADSPIMASSARLPDPGGQADVLSCTPFVVCCLASLVREALAGTLPGGRARWWRSWLQGWGQVVVT